ANTLTRGDDQRANRRGGAPLTTDCAAEIAGRHVQLQQGRAAMIRFQHADVIGLVRQYAADDLDHLREVGVQRAHDAGASAATAAASVLCRSTSVRSVLDGCAPWPSQ